MLDNTILQLPSREAKVTAVKAKIVEAIEAGRFAYTPLLLCHQELMTLGFEVMDAIKVVGGIPQNGQGMVYNVGPVRLVSITNEPITVAELYEPRIPGTDMRGKPVKRNISLGLDAPVDDSLDNGRQARRILLQHGWPIRNVLSRSGSVGHIVEWKWFEKAATSSDATEEYRKIYDAVMARPENAPKTKRTGAAQPAAGV